MLFKGEKVEFQNGSGIADGPKIFSGSSDTRAKVLAEVGKEVPVGSIYLSAARIYQKVANNGVAADWTKVTQTAAD